MLNADALERWCRAQFDLLSEGGKKPGIKSLASISSSEPLPRPKEIKLDVKRTGVGEENWYQRAILGSKESMMTHRGECLTVRWLDAELPVSRHLSLDLLGVAGGSLIPCELKMNERKGPVAVVYELGLYCLAIARNLDELVRRDIRHENASATRFSWGGMFQSQALALAVAPRRWWVRNFLPLDVEPTCTALRHLEENVGLRCWLVSTPEYGFRGQAERADGPRFTPHIDDTSPWQVIADPIGVLPSAENIGTA